MKLTVKTLKGTHFEIRVQPSDTTMAVKRNIEEKLGKDAYPWGQQLLIHNGKVLKDETTLDENKVTEDGFLVVMLSKNKASAASGASSGQSSTPAVKPPTPQEPPAPVPPPVAPSTATATTPAPTTLSSSIPAAELDPMVSQIMEMGGGSWDKPTVLRALRAAYNNPERAVEYLYSGIPVGAEVAVPAGQGVSAAAGSLSAVPNVAPLDMFPQVGEADGAGGEAGSLDFLRNNQQFQALREMVQANPQILQPMLLELSKQNPDLLRLIQDNHAEFLQLLNEAAGEEGAEGDQFDLGEQEEMPHSVSVTPEDQDAIARLEGMGFDRDRVIEAFLACDRNEQLAANYLLEHAFDED
ncbi:hypothetical protein LUZ60_017207 [Juncus effusus]|nr:hypothetical protein LUZ60_017207 [Juncus effusus]